jgi:hypothetical protein
MEQALKKAALLATHFEKKKAANLQLSKTR